MSKSFKILTHRPIDVIWKPTLVPDPIYGQGGFSQCPEYVAYTWCRRRKKFRREKEVLAVGVPYECWWRWGSRSQRRGWIDRGDNTDYARFGKELAAQNGLHWIDGFDPAWKMQDLVLLRLKGKI